MNPILDESIEAYHLNAAISHSKLADFRRSPLKFHRKHILRVGLRKKTRALAVGSAFDAMLLEPGKFNEDSVTALELEKMQEMKARVMQKAWLVGLILAAQKQVTFRQSFGAYSVQCRPDMYLPGGCEESEFRPCVIDLKTTADLGDTEGSSFRWDYRDYDYPGCAVFTQEVIAACTGIERRVDYLFLVCEKCEPFDCMIFRPLDEDLVEARQQLFEDLGKIRVCYETNTWQGCGREVATVELPRKRNYGVLTA